MYGNDPAFYEPFGIGPESWVRPRSADCPDCNCCTLDLCREGRTSPFGCVGRTSEQNHEARTRIAKCPCSEGPGTPNGEIAAAAEACLRGEMTEEAYRARVREISGQFDSPWKEALEEQAGDENR